MALSEARFNELKARNANIAATIGAKIGTAFAQRAAQPTSTVKRAAAPTRTITLKASDAVEKAVPHGPLDVALDNYDRSMNITAPFFRGVEPTPDAVEALRKASPGYDIIYGRVLDTKAQVMKVVGNLKAPMSTANYNRLVKMGCVRDVPLDAVPEALVAAAIKAAAAAPEDEIDPNAFVDGDPSGGGDEFVRKFVNASSIVRKADPTFHGLVKAGENVVSTAVRSHVGYALNPMRVSTDEAQEAKKAALARARADIDPEFANRPMTIEDRMAFQYAAFRAKTAR